jgi:ABC-2 type transport system permease protein
VLQLIIIGYAVTTDVRDVPVAVHDGDRSQRSRALVRSIEASGYFRIRPVASASALPRSLDFRDAELALEIPAGFNRHLHRRKPSPVQVLVDGSDSNSAGLASEYLISTLRAFDPDVAPEVGPPLAPAARGRVDLEPRVWFNPQLLSVHYMVPGVVAMVLLILTMVLTSLSIVREREGGTLEQLVVTPLRPWELLAGKMIPFGIFGMLDAVVVLLLVRIWFGVPLLGSPLVLLASVLGLLLNTLGTGLLISTMSRTQQQAQLTAFFVVIPSILLSGFMFPIENMPGVIQASTYIIAMRHFLEAERAVFLRGSGMWGVWPQMAALVALGTLTFLAGVLRFKKQLD